MYDEMVSIRRGKHREKTACILTQRVKCKTGEPKAKSIRGKYFTGTKEAFQVVNIFKTISGFYGPGPIGSNFDSWSSGRIY
jgi:hypothetical protein